MTTAIAYRADNLPTSISRTGPGAPPGMGGPQYDQASISAYSYDANKNRTAQTIAGVMSGHGYSVPTNGYDDADRLKVWNRADGNQGQYGRSANPHVPVSPFSSTLLPAGLDLQTCSLTPFTAVAVSTIIRCPPPLLTCPAFAAL